MTRSEVHELFKSYGVLEMERRQLLGEIRRLETAMSSPKAQAITGMPRGGGKADKLLDSVARHILLQEQYEDKMANILQLQRNLEMMLEGLPSRERIVMRYRYIQCLRWEQIEPLMNYESRQLQRIRDAALDKMAVMECRTAMC